MSKLEKLVHYICEQIKDDPSKLSAVKLNKILWFSDVSAYLQVGASITGERYFKRQFGIVPESIHFAIDTLKSADRITIRKEYFNGYQQKLFVSLRGINHDFLSYTEKTIVDDAIHNVCDNSTVTSVSGLIHDQLLDMVQEGEEIPLYAIFIHQPGDITEVDFEWAKRIRA